MKQLTLTLTASLLLLTGCNNTPPTQHPLEQQQTLKYGTYQLHTHTNANIQLQIPVTKPTQELRRLHSFFNSNTGNTYSYITADIDNRHGTEHADIHSVEAFDKDGNKYEFISITTYMTDAGISNTHFYNNNLESASKGERKTQHLVHPNNELPDEFTRIAVYFNGGMDEPYELH